MKTNIISSSFVVIALMFAISGCASLSHSKSKIEQRELTDIEKKFISTEYELLYRVKEIPDPLLTFLLKKAPGIVNTGEPFNSSDAIDPSLSSTQLSWAGMAKEINFILYKQGGFAPHQRLLIVELQQGQITTSALFIVPYYIDDMRSLKQIIQSGKATLFSK